jgi:hypothetical protein
MKDEVRDCDHGRMKGKCEVCDLQAELDATNRQVEILSDALAESRRQCKWPTCQSEEYQQALAEQIKQELVIGAAQRPDVDAMVALARADEREACAKVCEGLPMQQEVDVRDECAAAIRARGNT